VNPPSTLSRRDFLRAAALSAAGAGLALNSAPAQPAGLPKRTLGRTGRSVSILTLGLGAAGDADVDPGLVREITTQALDAGVTYLDTAPNYGAVQTAIAPLMAQRRSGLFLVSKVEQQTREEAAGQIEQSRRDLQTDVLDAVFIHNVGDFDLDHLLGPDGAFTALRQARDAGHVRFLGISGHNRPPKFLSVIATGEVDLIMMPTNFVDRPLYRFEETVLPAAREAKCGIIGMKVLGGVVDWNYRRLHAARLGAPEHYENAVRYALSLDGPATVAMGPCTLDELHQALDTVRRFRPLAPDEMTALLEVGARLAPTWGYHYGPSS
jgi:hypothetical protein